MNQLPPEIILHITFFLDTLDIVRLQLVSHRFLHIARDNSLWRAKCFEDSLWDRSRRRRENLAKTLNDDLRNIQSALRGGSSNGTQGKAHVTLDLKVNKSEKMRILANWDPTYPRENVDWYSEFIHRSAPITANWLQQPRNVEGGEQYPMEVRGAGIFEPIGCDESSMVVGPLDDGSICIWDVKSNSEKRGRIISRSATKLLHTSQSSSGVLQSRIFTTGITDCVSIDNYQRRAYIAFQCELVEVDLETLQVVSQEKFPFSIAVISESKHPTPITVGTNLTLHLHDPRTSLSHYASPDVPEQLDVLTHIPGTLSHNGIVSLQPKNYSPLFHPGPLSIVHVPASPGHSDTSGEIYVAGRFSSILNYDRRFFPKLRRTIFSGARLCSMTWLPYSFAADLKDRMRRGELSVEQIAAAKAEPGSTLIACGEYGSKGSLELYGISQRPRTSTMYDDVLSIKPQIQDSVKNRQTSSSSKLLSVSTHGTRLVFSDGGGHIKWVERDGFTGVRDWNIGSGSVESLPGIFGTSGDSFIDTSSGDIVRKILHTKSTGSNHGIKSTDTDDLILWTGEKLALLSFSTKPMFGNESFGESEKSIEDLKREKEEKVYRQTMKRALKMQADETRFITGLGLGFH